MSMPQKLPHYSFKIALLASFLLLSAANLARADDFSVDNVVVDATDKDATTARVKALGQGQTEAFKLLMIRRDTGHAPDILAKTKPDQITAMVRGYQVIDEKLSGTHYHATVRYTFDPAAIMALSPAPTPVPGHIAAPTSAAPAPAPVAFTVPKTKSILVLPVYNDAGTLKLWQDDNAWRNTWYDAALESGGGFVVAPLGDLEDRVDVDDTNVSSATAASLARMYARYGVSEIAVVSAVYNLKADPKPALEVSVRRIAPGKNETSQMSYTIRSTENLNTLMIRASNDIARLFYHQQTVDPNKIEYERLKEITARVNTSDIREWEALRQRLLMRSNIVSVRVTSVSYYETTMIITFKGTPDMLGKTLVASGLRVMQDGDSLVLALQ